MWLVMAFIDFNNNDLLGPDNYRDYFGVYFRVRIINNNIDNTLQRLPPNINPNDLPVIRDAA
ncbi:hypothetical protein A2625_00650 [candidate division WOR-1 bacterium RIFCSPHIGHO2_01_FULL_53_15]|uniref:Uncharacterized protein n=1 Tax=candidate division WOR-1 bacterium RIFCSPHIGHO2_01_FULL_53_15 TaxID=1802564 RepID=A0A1F4Q3D9_UNCSA|nr:MAG: hypothetical protein A2625_00650 [candidate division WOR-1 bacterium RIFCSPHIGHO2_01_FULL_53_15]OGC12674.1 MAG: hypothetical protein A3D23_02915 [candidate division WOR-1 bacterium RIFCSPHIGHO2_02_FULL_53_26]